MSADDQKCRTVAEGILDCGRDNLNHTHLHGSRCCACAETTLGMNIVCPKCGGTELQGVALSDIGTLYTFTIIRHRPPGNYHVKDDFRPFAVGLVELEQGVRVMAPLVATEKDLKIGVRMRLKPFVLRTDDQNREVIGFAYKPEL